VVTLSRLPTNVHRSGILVMEKQCSAISGEVFCNDSPDKGEGEVEGDEEPAPW
jgi:hypothetical protein